MKRTSFHYNLLRDTERVTSSPVRVRVMLPILALLACAGGLVWWGMLAAQLLVVRSQASALREELAGKKAQHAVTLGQMLEARDKQAQYDQLRMYIAARRPLGEALARLAEVVPSRVQLTSLTIPEPEPQDLSNPANRKGPPLAGPTGNVERVTLRLVGRTTKETPVLSLMEALEAPAFADFLKIDKDPRSADLSPRVRSFRQDAASASDALRLLVFDVEYVCAERRYGE